jgi:predicted GTPase
MATSDVKECPQDPILVAVMGQTGTGKSSFINKATGASLLVGHALSPCTRSHSYSLPYISVC